MDREVIEHFPRSQRPSLIQQEFEIYPNEPL